MFKVNTHPDFAQKGSTVCFQYRLGNRIRFVMLHFCKQLATKLTLLTNLWFGSTLIHVLAKTHFPYLVLPRNRYRSSGKLRVKVAVLRVDGDPFHCGELLDVQHVFGVHGVRLNTQTCYSIDDLSR